MPVRRVILDHLTLGVSDLERSRAFYEAALRPLGIGQAHTHETLPGVAFGPEGLEDFIISPAYPVGAPVHVALAADSRAQVDGFHAAGLAAGGRDNGGPGIRPAYSESYYGAFLLDPDGHNVEAVFHEPTGG